LSTDQRFPWLLQEAPSRHALGQFVRELGYLLPKARLRDLRAFRAEVATVRDHPKIDRPEEAFTQGALFAMAEICASYEAEIQAEEDRRQRAAFSIEKPLDNAVLHKIFEGVTNPGKLAEVLGKDGAQISRSLNDLRATGLIEVVPPSPVGDQRRRFYRLTTEGLQILSSQGWQASPGEPKDMMILESGPRQADYLGILSSRHCRFVNVPPSGEAHQSRVSTAPPPRPMKPSATRVRSGAYPREGRAYAAGPLAS
jgi:DNA-binding transcriptional ArsR family regulator